METGPQGALRYERRGEELPKDIKEEHERLKGTSRVLTNERQVKRILHRELMSALKYCSFKKRLKAVQWLEQFQWSDESKAN